MADTLSQLVSRTAQRLSMVYASGVQTFAEDVLAEMIQHKFDILFDEVFWDQFTDWHELALDGTLGVLTADLSSILKRIDDIQTIFLPNTTTQVLKLPSTVNPFPITGTTPRYYAAHSDPKRVIKFYPATSTGNLQIRLRTKPATFTLDDEINFDDQALILGAAFDYAEDDGTNPAATQKLQGLFESRVKQIKSLKNDASIPLDPISYGAEFFTFTPLS